MSKFERCLEKVLQFEGRYSNDPKDPGGETYCGIARAKHPNWEGWKGIDAFKKLYKRPPYDEYHQDFTNLVKAFYLKNFWEPLRCEEIESEGVVCVLFDTAVNCGVDRAVRLLQQTLNESSNKLLQGSGLLTIDGKIGNISLARLNFLAKEGVDITTHFTVKRIRFYLGINNPTFIRGWIHRALTVAGL